MLGLLLPLVAIALSLPSYADEAAVRALSEKYARDMYPAEPVDAWWMKEKLLNRYPYMHAMVVAAFYAKQKDHQAKAFQVLEKFECVNVIACQDLNFFLDGALKSNRLVMSKDHIKRAEKILAATNSFEKKHHFDWPPKEGLCNPEAKRAAWLALEYELFCPYVDRQEIKFKTEKDSQQLLMSSSFLQAFMHIGPKDCSEPWKAELVCGGGLERTYRLSCSRKGEKVECRE